MGTWIDFIGSWKTLDACIKSMFIVRRDFTDFDYFFGYSNQFETDYKTEKTLCKFNDSIVKPFRKLDTNLRQRLYE